MSSESLILVHSIIRHGERTQDEMSFYPNDPQKNNKYYPYGVGMLTNEGKRTMYTTGQAFRKRYDDFLGDIYLPECLDTWTTEYIRCRSSAQVLLAALFPPKSGQKWSDDLNWQPIPTNFTSIKTDELMGSVISSNTFKKLYLAVSESEYVKDILKRNEDIISYMEKHTGSKISSFRHLFVLHDGLKTQNELGLPLPEWTLSVFPEKLGDLAYKEYEMQVHTKQLKKIVCGQLLKKILADTRMKIIDKSQCKMHLYLGHDVNIANMLIVLGLSSIYKPYPQYASALTFEVHRIDDKYGIKLMYKKNKTADFEDLTLGNGNTIWWIEEFEQFINDLWTDDINTIT